MKCAMCGAVIEGEPRYIRAGASFVCSQACAAADLPTVQGAVPRTEYGINTPCPICNDPLTLCVGLWEGVTYPAVRCWRGCDLWEIYG